MKITGEIFQVGGSGMTAPGDAAIYLINFGGHGALVDAGCGHAQDRLFRNVQDCGIQPWQIEYLLITHCHYDHTGGVRGVKDRAGCQVVSHVLEAPFMERGDNTVTGADWYGATLDPFNIDRKISGERGTIDLGGREIEAVHMPGHSPGSMVYLTESDGLKVLFGQDVHGPLDSHLLSNRKDYQRSLKRLMDLGADILCEGHYGVFYGKEEVVEFIRSFL